MKSIWGFFAFMGAVLLLFGTMNYLLERWHPTRNNHNPADSPSVQFARDYSRGLGRMARPLMFIGGVGLVIGAIGLALARS